MSKKKKPSRRDMEWAKAKRLCRLSADDVRMAKELGFLPRSLIKNIPSASQPWKARVKDWVRGLYEKKMEKAAKKKAQQKSNVVHEDIPAEPAEFLDVVDECFDVEDECFEELDDNFDCFSEPTEKDIRETNRGLLRRRQEYRRAAELVASELSMLFQVRKVVLFGSVAMPLQKEIPRFREYSREGIAVWHECKDVDLAIWVSDLDRLKDLQRARTRALSVLLETENIGVAHHQVELFVMEIDSDRYLGRVCCFGQCPKERKQECSVKGCGQERFLRQHEDFVFRSESLAPDRSIILFERSSGPPLEDDDAEIPF